MGYTVAEAGKPLPLAPASFEMAVLVQVLGEVGDQAQCLRSLASVLKPGGILAVHEGVPDPDRIPVPLVTGPDLHRQPRRYPAGPGVS